MMDGNNMYAYICIKFKKIRVRDGGGTKPGCKAGILVQKGGESPWMPVLRPGPGFGVALYSLIRIRPR